jgi:hypothetical protein
MTVIWPGRFVWPGLDQRKAPDVKGRRRPCTDLDIKSDAPQLIAISY